MNKNFNLYQLLLSSVSVYLLLLYACSKREIDCHITTDFSQFPHVFEIQESDTVVFSDSLGNDELFIVNEKFQPQSYSYEVRRDFEGPSVPLLECDWLFYYIAQSDSMTLVNRYFASFDDLDPIDPIVRADFIVDNFSIEYISIIPQDTLSIIPENNMQSDKLRYHSSFMLGNTIYTDVYIKSSSSSETDIIKLFISSKIGVIGYQKANGIVYILNIQ